VSAAIQIIILCFMSSHLWIKILGEIYPPFCIGMTFELSVWRKTVIESNWKQSPVEKFWNRGGGVGGGITGYEKSYEINYVA
jgi:hypothetical protein